MENNWVDERLATLGLEDDWQPNVSAAMSRLRERRDAVGGPRPRWIWAAAATAMAGVCLVAFPAPRALAQRCVSCSAALWQSIAAAGPGCANLTPERDRKPAPDFTLKDASGQRDDGRKSVKPYINRKGINTA